MIGHDMDVMTCSYSLLGLYTWEGRKVHYGLAKFNTLYFRPFRYKQISSLALGVSIVILETYKCLPSFPGIKSQ